ncbi:MAG TPA: DUF5665 domain-containing protein [Patescibacteria group bacterium]
MLGFFDNLHEKVGHFIGEAEEVTERDQLITELELLSEQMRKLNARLYKQTSARYVFFHAVLAGIGSAIGATIIAGMVIAILARTIHTIEDVPIVGNIVQNELIQNQFETDR